MFLTELASNMARLTNCVAETSPYIMSFATITLTLTMLSPSGPLKQIHAHLDPEKKMSAMIQVCLVSRMIELTAGSKLVALPSGDFPTLANNEIGVHHYLNLVNHHPR